MPTASSTRSLRRGMAVWLVLSVVGAMIVAFPDQGERMFSFSPRHGPSPIDAVGISVLLAGWVAFLFPLWSLRAEIQRRRLTALAGVLGAGVTIWSVGTDSGRWWLVGAALLVAVQVIAALSVLGVRRRARPSEDL